MDNDLRYIPAAEDDDDWPPREEAPPPEEDGALTQETRQALPAARPQSTTRVDLVRFLESLTPAELGQWMEEGHVRPKG